MKTNPIVKIGKKGIAFFIGVYEITVLLGNAAKTLPRAWFYRRQISEQLYNLSVNTLPIAALIAVFVGLSSTVLGIYQSSGFVPRYMIVSVIYKSMIIELTPVILCLVLAGKIGASLAAEIGSMKISEQIEALEMMSLEPVGFLVLPRILAGLIMLPVITIFANFISIFSSFFVLCVATSWISPMEFLSGLKMDYWGFEIFFGTILKPAVFGIFITLIGSHFGLKTRGGARGVGAASTNAVVVSAVLIVIFDYYLSKLLL
jgi:phospholipid/cholesterol/gamma-HCH transport system permease protein